MGLFGSSRKQLDYIAHLVLDAKEQLAEIESKTRVATEESKLTEKVNQLKREVADLEISKSKESERHERERREVEHYVGLERKRQEFEIAAGKRETAVQVREENLVADRERFAEQMKFNTDRFTSEVSYLKDLMERIMERLPNVEVALGGAKRKDE